MSEAVKAELWLFLVSIVTGVATGVVFDFFRAMRRIREEGGRLVYIEDILFWLCEAALIFSVLYNFNYGQPRFYFFIGLASGAAIYLLTVSSAVIFVLEKAGVLIKLLLSFVIKILKSVFRIFIKPVMFVAGAAKKSSAKLKKRLKMY